MKRGIEKSMNRHAWAAVICTAALIFLGAFVIVPAQAGGNGTNDQVCAGLDSGKIDTNGNPQTITITAPAGKLIDQYCVKAGSAQQGEGPVYVTVDPPQATVTFSHPSGKDISHYSYSWTDVTTPSPTPTPTPSGTPTVTPSPTPSGTPSPTVTSTPTPTQTPSGSPSGTPTTSSEPSPSGTPSEPTETPDVSEETKTEHKWTCEYHTVTTYTKVNGEWVATSSSKTMTGRDCSKKGKKTFVLKEEGM